MKTLILVLALSATAAKADEMFAPMSDAEYARQAVISMTFAIDCHQTQQIRQRNEAGDTTIGESNKMIRSHFSEPGIRNYFIASAIVSAGITKALPAEWRPVYQYGVIAYQVATIIHNKKASLSISF